MRKSKVKGQRSMSAKIVSWRAPYTTHARQRRHSKMAVRRHLGFYRTENSTIRSADPENPNLEPNMERIGCTVCEIFAFKLYSVYCDLETGVLGHSRSSKAALFDKAHTNSYSSSIVTMSFLLSLRDIAAYWSKIATPLYLAPTLGWSRQIYATTLGDEKLEWWTYEIVKEFRWCVQPFWHKARVWQTDRQTDGLTDGIGVAYTRYSMLSRVKLLLVANDCHMGRGWMGAEREVMTSPTIVLAATSAHCKCWT